MPIRIQRKRTKGWEMPENTVSVCRPGKFGNPFSIAPKQAAGTKVGGGGYIAVPTIEDAIECYRIWLTDVPAGIGIAEMAKKELRGKNLACFCKVGEQCHADILLEIANA